MCDVRCATREEGRRKRDKALDEALGVGTGRSNDILA
jgi:hypothetical protein